jgi:hypothetical protein
LKGWWHGSDTNLWAITDAGSDTLVDLEMKFD